MTGVIQVWVDKTRRETNTTETTTTKRNAQIIPDQKIQKKDDETLVAVCRRRPPVSGICDNFKIWLQQCHAFSVCQCVDVDRIIAGRKRDTSQTTEKQARRR